MSSCSKEKQKRTYVSSYCQTNVKTPGNSVTLKRHWYFQVTVGGWRWETAAVYMYSDPHMPVRLCRQPRGSPQGCKQCWLLGSADNCYQVMYGQRGSLGVRNNQGTVFRRTLFHVGIEPAHVNRVQINTNSKLRIHTANAVFSLLFLSVVPMIGYNRN